MKFFRNTTLVVVAALALLLTLAPAAAQDDAPPVLILPINNANFLPGAMFDFRVEVHAEALPDNFAVSVNGTPAADFFGAAPTEESWVFGADEEAGDPGTPSQSVIWRELTAPEPGEYVVEVTAGGTTASATWTVREPQSLGAKNVILFVADGMTIAMLSAARAARGIEQGTATNPLVIDSFDHIGLARTSSVDSLMADSANTFSSVNTGHIGSVNSTGSYSDTSPDTFDDPRTETLGEMLKRLRGMSVGVVTTADISDATPAAVWAHGRNRSNTNRNEYLVQALEFGPEVFLGGGARRFLPMSVEGSRREDERDLFAEYETAGYTLVTSATEMSAAMGGEAMPERLLGIFNPNDMSVWLDRNVYTDNVGEFTDQPDLSEMTLAALGVLNQNPNGFYLEVEAASVDKQMHPLDMERTLADLIEFDTAVGAAIEWVNTNAPDTLIVVTADHGHGFDVYGTVDTATFNAAEDDLGRRAAIRVYGGAGYPTYTDADGDGQPEWADATIVFAGTVNNHPEYTEDFQVSETPRVPAIADENGIYLDNPEDDPNGIFMSGNLAPDDSTGVHTLQDVPVFAMGPGAEAVMGTYHQSELFFVMAAALSLDPSAEGGMVAAAPVETETLTAGVNLPANASGLALLVVGLLAGFAVSRIRR